MRAVSYPLTASNSVSSRRGDRLRPPAPIPRRKPLGTIDLLKALRDNPLEAWDESYFEKPIVTTKVIVGRVAMINDPVAIKHVLVDNTANYRKDTLQQRVLSAGMGGGLLTAEADQWRMQRRTLAPIFFGKIVVGFTSIMAEEADKLVEQWRSSSAPVVDLAVDATCVAICVLERTLPLLLLPNLAAVLLGLALVGVGTFFAQAAATGFAGRAATAERGAASGIYLACYFFGGLVGSALLGQLFDRLG